ncbi:MAG: DUF21 domain-containing protein [Planctomycetales bacterium]|nr:DUF21 domain-containing protein [Planctomycetales bacterium]
MDMLQELAPWLTAMGVLIAFSGFFSASEAALFSLRWQDQREMRESGTRGERWAVALLSDPERLLSAVLFWNLLVNMLYFSMVSIVGLKLEQKQGAVAATGFSTAAMLSIIFLSEMLPKSVAVLKPRLLARWQAMPLAGVVWMIGPMMPVLRMVNLLSRRLVWPRFQPEPQLEADDLERAVERSHMADEVARTEHAALRNILLLSDVRVDEWMRPRAQFRAFRPPVRLSDLEGERTPSGYLLVTEPDGDEDDIAAAVPLAVMAEIPKGALDRYAVPVSYVPWCATVADALQQMQDHHSPVVAVVNEYGETIGILTQEDVLETMFTYSPSRSKLLLDKNPIHPLGPDHWLVAGVTSLRRLSQLLRLELPPSRSVTVAGALQDHLQRLVREGDEGQWGPFEFRVAEIAHRGHLVVELRLASPGEEQP